MVTWDGFMELVRDYLAVHRLRESFEFADLDDIDDVNTLADMVAKAEELASAVAGLRSDLEGLLAAELGEGGALRVGDSIRRYSKQFEEKCHDPDGFRGWLEANPDIAAKAFNPNSVRKSVIPSAVRDTFFERFGQPAKLVRVPIDKAPAFLQGLEEGEVFKP